jgi:hypothetical protein
VLDEPCRVLHGPCRVLHEPFSVLDVRTRGVLADNARADDHPGMMFTGR